MGSGNAIGGLKGGTGQCRMGGGGSERKSGCSRESATTKKEGDWGMGQPGGVAAEEGQTGWQSSVTADSRGEGRKGRTAPGDRPSLLVPVLGGSFCSGCTASCDQTGDGQVPDGGGPEESGSIMTSTNTGLCDCLIHTTTLRGGNEAQRGRGTHLRSHS